MRSKRSVAQRTFKHKSREIEFIFDFPSSLLALTTGLYPRCRSRTNEKGGKATGECERKENEGTRSGVVQRLLEYLPSVSE